MIDENKWSEQEIVSKGLIEESRSILSWSWDERFACVLAQFSIDQNAQVLEILEKNFCDKWDSSSIKEASKRVQLISHSLGGIRPGQFLLTTESEQDVILLGVWWPWGNGKVISIRIIPNTEGLSDSDMTAFIERFKGWFGF